MIRRVPWIINIALEAIRTLSPATPTRLAAMPRA